MPPPRNPSSSYCPIRAGSSIYGAILPRHVGRTGKSKVARSENRRIGDELQPHGDGLSGRRVGDGTLWTASRQGFLDDVANTPVGFRHEQEHRPKAGIVRIVEVLASLERHVQLRAWSPSRPHKRLGAGSGGGEGHRVAIDAELDALHVGRKLRLYGVVE